MTVELMNIVITESWRNIDKTKVYSRHKKTSLFLSRHPSICTFYIRSLCDTTSHPRLIIFIHEKQLENYKYLLRTRSTTPRPDL